MVTRIHGLPQVMRVDGEMDQEEGLITAEINERILITSHDGPSTTTRAGKNSIDRQQEI